MAIVTPHAWVAGTDYGTAPNLNTLTDAISQLQGGTPSAGALDFCLMRQATAQTGLTNAAFTAVTWDTEIIDSANGHSTVTNPTRYTAVNAGYYDIHVGVAFATNATGIRGIELRINGTTTVAGRVFSSAISGSSTEIELVRTYFLAAGDYVEAMAYQNSGAALALAAASDVGSFIDLRWVHS